MAIRPRDTALRRSFGGRLVEADHGEPGLLQPRERAGDVRDDGVRQMLQGPGGGADGRGGDAGRTPGAGDERCGTGRLGRPRRGPEVLRIGDPVQDDDEGVGREREGREVALASGRRPARAPVVRATTPR